MRGDRVKSEKLSDLAKKMATTFALVLIVFGGLAFINFEESPPSKTPLLILCVPLSIGAFVFYTVRFLWVLVIARKQE